jgi:hypothetical protein
VNEEGLKVLRADLDRFWTHALAAFKAAAEKSTKAERQKRRETKKP